ncbi:hypothetical protein BB560_005550, partial [Smittium megazygosporum]
MTTETFPRKKKQSASKIQISTIMSNTDPLAEYLTSPSSFASPTFSNGSSFADFEASKLKNKFLKYYNETSHQTGRKVSKSSIDQVSLSSLLKLNPNKPNSSNKNINSYSPLPHKSSPEVQEPSKVSSFLQRYMIKLEMINLGDPEICPSGIYTMTSFTSFNIWYGCLFVHHGPWKGGVFKFKVLFPNEYPYKAPEIYFLTKLNHPLVSKSDGKFNLKPQFPEWKAYEDYLFLALAFMKNSFKSTVLSSLINSPALCFNQDALKMYINDRSQFEQIASLDTERSLQPNNLYKLESPDCPINFSPLSDSQFGFLLTRFELPNKSNPGTLPIGNQLDFWLYSLGNFTSSTKASSAQAYTNSPLSNPETNSNNGNDFFGKDSNENKMLSHPRETWFPQQFDRAIVLVVDALRFDFAAFNYSNSDPNVYSRNQFATTYNENNSFNEHFKNKMPKLFNALSTKKEKSMLFRFRADPPTTTLQRLKGLTTGQLPTFIDAGSNFGGSEITEDNWISQFYSRNSNSTPDTPPSHKNIAFLGDDTWARVFPSLFANYHSFNNKPPQNHSRQGWVFSRPFPSLDVWDLDTVDDGVFSRLPLFLLNSSFSKQFSSHSEIDFEQPYTDLPKQIVEWKNTVKFKSAFSNPDFSNKTDLSYLRSWDLLISHTLGVDHVGHRYGPNHFEMSRKLGQADDVISLIINSIDNQANSSHSKKRTILYVFGDHGMNSKGDHGGDSDEELDAALFVYSSTPIFSDKSNSRLKKVYKLSFSHLNSFETNSGIYTDMDIRSPFAHNGHQFESKPVRSVLQIDWVPTFSLLMGSPIPFNNLGSIIGEMFANTSIPVYSPSLELLKNCFDLIEYKSFKHSPIDQDLKCIQKQVLKSVKSENPKSISFLTEEWGFLYGLRLNAAQLVHYLKAYHKVAGNSAFSRIMERNWLGFYSSAQLAYTELLKF